VTPEKAWLLATLTGERFPDPDVLEHELRAPAPVTPRLGTVQAGFASSDTPAECAKRRRVLAQIPVTMRDVQPLRVPLEDDDLKGVA
jgi:hypothetical protein